MKCDNCKKTIKEDAEYCPAKDRGKGISPHIIYNPDTGETVKNLCHNCFKAVCPTHQWPAFIEGSKENV